MLSVEIGKAHQKVSAQTAVRLPPTHARHAAIGFHVHARGREQHAFSGAETYGGLGNHPQSFE